MLTFITEEKRHTTVVAIQKTRLWKVISECIYFLEGHSQGSSFRVGLDFTILKRLLYETTTYIDQYNLLK